MQEGGGGGGSGAGRGWWPSGARAERMLGFLGANLTSVSRKTKLPRGEQSNATAKQLLSEQRNFKYFLSKAERISDVPSYTQPSCCRKQSNLYIGTQGTKLRSRIKKAQSFTNFNFPAV